MDLVVSDHSPCTLDLKQPGVMDFMEAWGGIASVQFGKTWGGIASVLFRKTWGGIASVQFRKTRGGIASVQFGKPWGLLYDSGMLGLSFSYRMPETI